MVLWESQRTQVFMCQVLYYVLHHLELWNIDKTRLDHSNKVSISYEQANTFEMCDGSLKSLI